VKPRTIVLWAGALALAGGGFWYLSRKKKEEAKAIQKGYPANERFPTKESFGFGLLALGYPTAVGTPGWKINDAQTTTEIIKFQKDFNLVRRFVEGNFGVEIGPKEVRTDGVVDMKTVAALAAATDFVELNKDDVGTWPEVVQEARLPPIPPPPEPLS
jgi:LPXTG-motif cell wall-anchored protein